VKSNLRPANITLPANKIQRMIVKLKPAQLLLVPHKPALASYMPAIDAQISDHNSKIKKHNSKIRLRCTDSILNQRSTKVPNDQSNPSITPSHLT
jgi:hypothetical protein